EHHLVAVCSIGVVVAMHHAFGRGADDRTAHGANRGAERSTGEANDASGHRASGGGASGRGMRLTAAGRHIEVTGYFGIIVPIHGGPPVLTSRRSRERAAAY